ncbi:MAG: hypothetical protein K2X82_14850 [Gemmataceae bacterium]|nr:hypothetical protein [Gemmataceae bacterium]
MMRRVIDTGIVFCALTVCGLISGIGELLAAPGDCDKECREVLVVAVDRGAPLGLRCTKNKFNDCNVCVNSGGCDKNVAAKGGTCNPTALNQQDCQPNPCTILCNAPAVGTTYEAHTNDPIANYKANGQKVHVCEFN